jgi:flagellar hook-associated protein 2
MGSISTGVGLMSGIDTASLIESLLAIEQRGKIPIQMRLAQLATAKSALLDVNSRLLGLKSAASAFRTDQIFQSVLATSSRPDQVGVMASGSPRPGSYSLLVKQLATRSQFLTDGYASRDSSPLGLDELSFEFGNGRLSKESELGVLNGGNGVQRGRIWITDRSGEKAEVDLTQVTTLEEVVEAINSTSGVSVEAKIGVETLVINDLSGGTGQLIIEDGVGSSTASDLGIAKSVLTETLVGDQINMIGLDTSLASLNDQRGVLIRDGITDFVVSVGGIDYDIDLGRVDAPITGTTVLDKLNGGSGISINEDPDEPDLKITTSTGQVVTIDLGQTLDEDGLVDLDEVETVQELLDRVNGALADEFGAGQVTMTINADGNGFTVTDSLGGAGDLAVEGAGPGGDDTAEDLGILGTAVAGVLQGTVLRNEVQTARAESIRDLQDRVDQATGGLVQVGLGFYGKGLVFSAAGQPVELKAGAPGFTGDAADIPERTLSDLGFSVGSSGTQLAGTRILSSLDSVLINGLFGGEGLGGADSLTITDKNGATTTIIGLSPLQTMSDLLNVINVQLEDAGVDARVELDAAGIGVQVVDTSSAVGTLTVSGDLATVLGVDGSTEESSIRGPNLELQYVTESTRLDDLNYGRGIGTGTFRLTDSTGATASVNIGSDDQSLYDVMKLINTRGLEIRAEINANGDGLTLVDTTSENGGAAVSAMKVEDTSGAVASSLRIAGDADSPGEGIDGTYAVSLDLDVNDTMDDLLSKIDDADIPLTATVLNTGSGARPYYLSFTSGISGLAGDVVIDTKGVDLGLDELVKASDSKAFLGSADPTRSLLVTSSTNQLDVIDGLQIDLLGAGPELVTIDVSTDRDTIIGGVQTFVDSFNDVISRINEYDSYNQDTEVRGPLLGDPTVAQVRNSLYSTLQRSAENVDGPYQFLSQIGITIGSGGSVEFDSERFEAAWNADPEGVEALFVSFESQTSSSEEISEGITIERNETFYSSLGFGDLFDQMLEGLTDGTGGLLTRADERFQTLIDSQNERIERIDQRIFAKRERLQREFAAMEAALAQLQGQQGALMGLSSNLGIA